ncbi:MAG: hypothetical protein ABI114_15565 [Rhodanobacter sp.]
MLSATSNTSSRWRAAAPFMVVAVLAVVGGGLTSAALAHQPTLHAMWLVAYLVLVVGVSQWLLGAGQSWLAKLPPSPALVAGECVLFNVANVLVMAGTLAAHPAWVNVGALILVLALVLFLFGVRCAPRGGWVYGYRTVVVLLAGSAGVGVLLTMLRTHA